MSARRFLSLLLTLAPALAPALDAIAAGPPPAPAPAAPALTKLPKVKRAVEATYPPLALRDRVEAAVVLDIEIDEQGYVSAVDVISSSTTAESRTSSSAAANLAPARSSTIADYGFVDAAKIAVARLEFEPAEAAGKPVAVRIQYTYRFKLPPPPPPPAQVAVGPGAETAPPPKPNVLSMSGLILSRGLREKVAGVVVTVFRERDGKQEGYEAITDKEGSFRFYDLEPGEWKVLAEADGYYPLRTTETIAAGQVTELKYYIEKGTYNPYDVLVEAERVKKEVTRRTLTTQEIVRVPGTLGDPIQVVENLPGVARPTGGGLIIVRGSGPQDTGVFIDGVDIPLIYHFGGLRSVVPAEVIDSVDFYPGNYSVYYGRKMGGVFDAKLKRLAPDAFHGSLDVSLLDASLYLEAPISDNAAIAIAGRRSYIDFVLNAVVPDDANVNLVSAPVYYDYQILSSWRPAPAHDLRAYFLGSDDKLALLFKNPQELSIQSSSGSLNLGTSFWRAVGEYRWTPSKSLGNELKIAGGRDIANFNFGTQFKFNLAVTSLQGRESLEWKPSDAVSLTAGADALINIADVEVLLPRPPQEGMATMSSDIDEVLYTNIKGQLASRIAPFVELSWTLGSLTLIPGVRLDWWQLLDEVSVDPRLSVRYKLSDHWAAKGGVGVFQQDPLPQDTDVVFGNPDLALQRAIHTSVGGEWTPVDWFKVDLTLFHKKLDALVGRTDATVTRDGKTVPLNVDNNTKGTVIGLELYIEQKFHENFRGWLSYTLSRAARVDPGTTEERLFDFDQTHILNLVASYQFPENWEIGARFRIVSGNPYTPYLGGVLQSDLDVYVPIPSAVNSARLPLFYQLDLRADKSWIFDLWRLSAYLSLTNSTNHTNAEGYTYNFDFTQRKPTQGLPIFPILGLKADF